MLVKLKRKSNRIVSFVLALVMVLGLIPGNTIVASAASNTVKLTMLGRKGTVSYGSKSKSGKWWQMKLGGQEAFCLDLGHTCHSGNTYASENKYTWNQDTGGEKHGYYAKIIRWYVLNGKRSKKGFVMGQALVWSVEEGRTSEAQLKDVIKQVKSNTGYYASKTVNELYQAIFEPSGNWTADVTIWKKTGNSKSYQRLMTVDAEKTRRFFPEELEEVEYYRQRITVMKKDENGQGVGGIQFTLDAKNLDDLYSFSVSDRNGLDTSSADEDNETSFSLTGYTRDSGRLAYRMTYRLQSESYSYYKVGDLEKMTEDEKKAAKQYLIDELELEEGVDFGPNMTKEEAQKLANSNMKGLKADISNTYTLTEDNTGDNKHLLVDPEYAAGKEITLTKADSWYKDADGNWPDSLLEIPSEYSHAYITGVTNKYKKASIKVVKTDNYSADKKAHGDATLEGAEFQLFEDQGCTTKAVVYHADGSKKSAGTYAIHNGTLTTDYLRSGKTYYLKEVKAPVGYTLSVGVIPICADASNVTVEYTPNISQKEVGNKPILGKVAIQKYYSDGETGELSPEGNTTFQVYLKSKECYENCSDYERATIKTDANGFAQTKDLYYGTYVVHQVDSGDVDAILVDDFEVEVTEDGKVYTYVMNNKLFKAYLKILKIDGKTQKQVLKPGTAYQIYKVTDEGEELVKQSYSNGNKIETVDTFISDESGEIITVKPLRSGTYRIYETEAASGLHITTEFIEVTINSKADNYESYTDEDGFSHAIITMEYTNEETYGKLSISKTGEMLSGWDKEEQEFVYENQSLVGAEFLVYANEDIVTQDNQGTTWFKKGDEVAKIVTGKEAMFTSDCNGICNQMVDEEGVVHITLPLGKYKVVETKTLYGYVFPEKHEWDLEFTWENSKDEFVINFTNDTDEEGILNVENLLAKPRIELLKEDADSLEGIGDAVFGLYTANDIYSAKGEKIVSAGTELTRLTTSEDGTVACDMELPLMDEACVATGSVVTGSAVSGSAVSGGAVESGSVELQVNTGDYYLKELSVSDSYYLDDTKIPVHLEYKDADTKVITAQVRKTNKQTTNEINKLSVGGSKELEGCDLVITDADGNKIVSWTSGQEDSVQVYVSEKDGYYNLKTFFDEEGNLHVGGLLHGKEYTLTETRPADGYVTAESIVYAINEKVSEDGASCSVVSIKQEDGSFAMQEDDKTVMVDEQTKILLIKLDAKTGQGLPGAKIVVTDENGNKVLGFTTTEDGVDITGKLVVGKTYTFTEISAPEGYEIAKPVKYTVKDTKDIQKISITDERTPDTPDVPQTGQDFPYLPLVAGLLLTIGAAFIVFRKKTTKVSK